jgi:superfamily II DNA or RNA helicase
MFSGIRRLLGNIKVVQTDNEIVISGLPADVIRHDISKIWNTSRINTYMFSTASRNTLAFPLFFAPDVYYMLDTMTTHRSRRTNVRTISKVKDLMMTETWLRDTQLEPQPRVDLKRLTNLIYKPLDYQQKFFESYDLLTQQYHLKGYLLSAVAGSGKTYIALALAECLKAERIIVVCPKNAIDRVWYNEINGLFKKPQTNWIYAHGKSYKGERIAVFHYESLNQAMDMVESLRSSNTVVILDESHNLNEVSSLRTQLFLDMVKEVNAADVLWMSGTPIKALGGESIPLLKSIDPYFTDDAQQRFKRIYGRDGNRGVDILRQRMGVISYKVEKYQLGLDKPVMKKLPVVIPNSKDYTLSAIRKDMQDFITERFRYYKMREKGDREFYYRCMQLHEDTLKGGAAEKRLLQYFNDVDIIKKYKGDARFCKEEIRRTNEYEKKMVIPSLPREYRNEFKNVKSIIKYLNLKIQGEALGRVLGRKRIQCHVDMVPYIDFKGVCNSTEKKTVVFTSFVEALEASKNYLDSVQMNPVAVYGKTNSELNKTIKMFEKQEDLNPLIATYQSLSTAVPLVMADTMIMINAPFRAYIHEQAISRIHRLGADTQTVVYESFLDTGKEPNISTRSNDILAWSQNQVEQIMGIKSPFQVEEGDGSVTVANEDYGLENTVTVQEVLQSVKQTPTYLDW